MSFLSTLRKRPPQSKEGFQVAMALLREVALPTVQELVAELNAREPGSATVDAESKPELVQLHFRGMPFIVALMPAPIPKHEQELDGPMRTSLAKPDADAVARHRAHAIVTVTAEKGVTRLEASLALSGVLGALAAHPATVAIYWAPGSVLTSPQVFSEFAQSSTVDEPPFFLWVTLHCFIDDDRTRTVATQGMDQFGVPELEIVRSPAPERQLMETVDFVGSYLITNGPVIEDGHTIGRSEEERIRASKQESVMGRDHTVLRLELP